MRFVKMTLQNDFIMPLNRKVALSRDDQHVGRFVGVETVVMEPQAVREVYVEDVDFVLFLSKHVFTNEDGSTAVWYLLAHTRSLC